MEVASMAQYVAENPGTVALAAIPSLYGGVVAAGIVVSLSSYWKEWQAKVLAIMAALNGALWSGKLFLQWWGGS